MAIKNILLACLAIATPALAHMQMDYPLPINSQHDPLTPANLRDYSYTSPLNADGSNFPCKGYQNQRPLRTTATFEAGATHNITIAGSATHLGGSCQISLSYDNGKTFRVIKSIIGGCPLTPSYDFTIPSYAPSGTALFAWTWFNEVGNREMYMNCAWIDVAAPTKQKRKQVGNSAKFRRQSTPSSLNDHPTIWIANNPQQNTCATTSGSDPVFPNPGPDVQYGGSMSSSSPASPGSCDGSSTPGATYQQLDTGNSASIGSSAPTDTAAPTSMSPTTSAFPTSSSLCSTTTTIYSTYTYTVSGSSTFAPTNTVSQSTTSLIVATATGPSTTVTFSRLATSTATASTQSSAPTASPASSSDSGSFSTANQGACGSAAMGTLKCMDSGNAFAMCNWGQWVSMGQTAAGTQCWGPDGEAAIVATGSSPSSSSGSGAGSPAPASSSSGSADSTTGNTSTKVSTDGNCDGSAMGSLKCTNDGQAWSMCNWGTWVNMGGVAAGTKCAGPDGSAAIVAA